MNSKNLVLVQHGTHRGLLVRSEADRDRVYLLMSSWSEPLQAIAKTYPVRIAEDADGWAFVRERALGDGLASVAFKSLGREMAKKLDPDAEPPTYLGEDLKMHVQQPEAPWGSLPMFRTETVHTDDGGGGLWEICADGKRVAAGAW